LENYTLSEKVFLLLKNKESVSQGIFRQTPFFAGKTYNKVDEESQDFNFQRKEIYFHRRN